MENPIDKLRQQIDDDVFDAFQQSSEQRRSRDAQILPPTPPKIESNFSAHPNVPFRTPDRAGKQSAQIGGGAAQTFEDITLADGSSVPAILEVEMESADWVAV